MIGLRITDITQSPAYSENFLKFLNYLKRKGVIEDVKEELRKFATMNSEERLRRFIYLSKIAGLRLKEDKENL